jgi:hypothetical protein
VYKNFDISGLFGMVGPLLKFARAAMLRTGVSEKVQDFAIFGEMCK